MNAGATVFSLEEIDTRRPNRDVANELAAAVAEEFPRKYAIRPHGTAPILVRESKVSYPRDPRIARTRAIACRVIRFRRVAALAVSASNHFDGFAGERVDTGLDRWRRSVSEISWEEHVRLVREFVLDLEDAGWLLPLLRANAYQARPVRYVNGADQLHDAQIRPSRLVQEPLVPVRALRLVVSDPENQLSSGAEAVLNSDLSRLCAAGAAAVSVRRTTTLVPPESDEVGLVVLPDSRPLEPDDDIVAAIAAWEGAGARFQVCRSRSLRDRFARRNIAFAISLLAGCVPWTTATHLRRRIVALDAGHAKELGKSRWCAAEYDSHTQDLTLAFHDGQLKENLTPTTLAALVPSDGGSALEVWRDGRWHKDDRSWLNKVAPGVDSFEITKDPRAVLFRGDLNNPRPPEFGDAVQYEEGDWLIQTVDANTAGGYRMPVRLRGNTDERFVDDLVALCRRPTQSLYQSSRLPAPLYWADRASKLSLSGWLRIVGHGWRLPPPGQRTN